jgi:MYXO-CTERM domain-containing protein
MRFSCFLVALPLVAMSAGCGRVDDHPQDAERLGTSAAELIWSEETVLTAVDTLAGDEFGNAVAASGDTVIIGAPKNQEIGFTSGAAYVFTYANDAWSLEAKLVASDAFPNQRFGSAVSLEGDTAVVGAVWGEAAYVFTRDGGTWTEQAKLTAPVQDWELGAKVALSGDRVLVSAPGSSDNGKWGRAHVFTRTGTTWGYEAILDASSPLNTNGLDIFGVAIALEGDTAIVAQQRFGAPNRAYVFTRQGTTWTEQAVLEASDPQPDSTFVRAVALAGDTAVIGAPTPSSGVVYEFQRQAGIWTELSPIPVAVDGNVGANLALTSPDTLFASVGDPAAVQRLTRGADGWTVQDTIPNSAWSLAAINDMVVVGDADADAAYVYTPEEGAGGAGAGGAGGASSVGGNGAGGASDGGTGGTATCGDDCDAPPEDGEIRVSDCACRAAGGPSAPPPVALAGLLGVALAVRRRRRE